MKHLKTFEYNNEIKVGEYVLCEERFNGKKSVVNFLKDNIGQIVEYDDGKYSVKYDLSKIKSTAVQGFNRFGIRLMDRDEIKFHNFDIEVIEAKIAGEKYNI